jgi:hypothetical protein
MNDQTMSQEIVEVIRDEAEKFPLCMLLIRDVFAFSFEEATKVSEKFSCNSELFAAFEEVKAYLADCPLPDDQRALLIHLLQEEAQVISYSQTTRCSVIAL